MAAPLSQQEAQEFIHDQDILCLECHRTSGVADEELECVSYLRYEARGQDGSWQLVCEQGSHRYIVRVYERETDNDLDAITMTWNGTWAQFRIAPPIKRRE